MCKLIGLVQVDAAWPDEFKHTSIARGRYLGAHNWCYGAVLQKCNSKLELKLSNLPWGKQQNLKELQKPVVVLLWYVHVIEMHKFITRQAYLHKTHLVYI